MIAVEQRHSVVRPEVPKFTLLASPPPPQKKMFHEPDMLLHPNKLK
jgi:hypothetical protein